MHKTICCDPSSEPSRRDGPDERSQHIVLRRNKENYPLIIIRYSILSRALLSYGCWLPQWKWFEGLPKWFRLVNIHVCSAMNHL